MKKLAVSFGIGAFLNSNFKTTTGTASKEVNLLNQAIRALEKDSKRVQSLKKMRSAIIGTSQAIAEKKREIDKLRASLKKEGVDTDKVKGKIKKLGKELSDLNGTYKKQKKTYSENSKKLKDEGVDVTNLSKSYEDLQKKIEKSEKAKKRFARASKVKAAGNKAAAFGAKGAAIGGAMLIPSIKKAIDSESAFADVKKQFDFATKEEAQAFRRKLETLITEKGMAISLDELYGAAATAGQSGIAAEDSLEYIEMATKMGVAFGISREQAAETMFQWKNAFNKPLPELKELVDQVNLLGNQTGASSPKISEFVNRIGNIGTNAGFTTGQIAGLGATLIEQGMDADVAATGAKKMMNAMTKGFAATGNQKKIYDMLGLNPQALAKQAQTDAQGAMLKILTSIKSQDKDKQGAILSMLFGEEGKRGAAGLLNNIERLQRNLAMAQDSSKYTGSAEAEFKTRQATMENQILVLKEMAAINVRNFGELLLPTISDAVERLTKFTKMLMEMQKANPKKFQMIAKAIVGIVGGLAGLSVVGKGISMATGAMTLLSNPVGLAIVGITALVAACYLLYKNWDTIKQKGIELKDKVMELVDKYWYMLGPLGAVFKAGKKIYENWDTIKAKAGELKDKIAEFVLNAVQNFKEFKDKTIEVLGIPFNFLKNKFEQLKQSGRDLKEFFLDLFDSIVEKMKLLNPVNLAKKGFGAVKGMFGKGNDLGEVAVKHSQVSFGVDKITPQSNFVQVEEKTKPANPILNVEIENKIPSLKLGEKASEFVENNSSTVNNSTEENVVDGSTTNNNETLVNNESNSSTVNNSNSVNESSMVNNNSSSKEITNNNFATTNNSVVKKTKIIPGVAVQPQQRNQQPTGNFEKLIPGFATGGFVTSPTIAAVGEGAYSEAIIPLHNDSNSLNLWEKTGKLIGAHERQTVSNNSSEFVFNYSPQVSAKDATGVEKVLKEHANLSYSQFKTYVEKYKRDKNRRGDGR